MNKHVFLVLAGIALIPAGCTLAPKYTRPAAPVPAEWPSGPAYAPDGTANAARAPELSWREFFTDAKLQQVIGMALTNNRDLRVAALNVERARAMYGIQRAELLPTLDAVGSGSKARVPADLSSSGHRQTIERYDANLGVASWEIDFFGRIRSFKDRALEEFLASEQARRSAQILLVSSVANAYLALAADRENLTLAETTLQTQQAAYDLVKRRNELGLVPDLDLFRARIPLDVARRDVAIYTQQVAKDENALNLLVGLPTASELLPTELNGVTPPEEITAGLSSEVLLLRPDVLGAEHQLKAANADIGAARAAFFPRISLTAAIGTASSELEGLFKSGSGAWSYAPQIVMPVFDARLWSAHKAAKVQRELAVTQYEQAIQSAFREVADALAVRGTVDRQVAAQQSLVNASAETYRLATSRYDKGIDSFLSVLDAQRSLFAAQQVLVLLRLERLANQVTLYAVLGGGWQPQASGNLAVMSAGSTRQGHN
ncbi:MAG TPA: efflux transporter outer membrane subunit [Candidatus Paceibacterota bacterium]|nr:efflux transporter outer membrane subunit [Verrucomicrobiota bacterium]HSA12907.1 efflux transporter outer membrane subunit [Candidatus Paceibacterota bacterium]